MFTFYDFGLNSAKIVVSGLLPAITFQELTCDAIKDQEAELQIDIVSCCTSAVLTEEVGGGRRLQLNNTNATNTTYIAEFNTNIVYTGSTCNNTCQVVFADAIESDVFGNMIGGAVVELEQIRSKSSKSSGGSNTKRSSGGTMKSGAGSGGSIEIGASSNTKKSGASGASGGTMKSGTMKSGAASGTMKSSTFRGTKKSGASGGSKKSGASAGTKKSGISDGSKRRFSGGGMKSGASRVGVDRVGPSVGPGQEPVDGGGGPHGGVPGGGAVLGMGPGVSQPRVNDTPGGASSKSKRVFKKKKKSF